MEFDSKACMLALPRTLDITNPFTFSLLRLREDFVYRGRD